MDPLLVLPRNEEVTESTPNGWRILDRVRGVWCYEYALTEHATANCLVARMPNQELLVLSPAVNLSDTAHADLVELGEVGAVVATNGFHHLGQRAWRSRYPNARFFAPPLSAARIRRKNPRAGAFEPLSELTPLLGSDVIVREAPSTKCGETWAIITVDSGHIWFASDIMANMQRLPAAFFPKLWFRLTNRAPGYHVFHRRLNSIVKDKKVVFRAMLDDLKKYPPTLLVPAHGLPVGHDDVATETEALVRAAL